MKLNVNNRTLSSKKKADIIKKQELETAGAMYSRIDLIGVVLEMKEEMKEMKQLLSDTKKELQESKEQIKTLQAEIKELKAKK